MLLCMCRCGIVVVFGCGVVGIGCGCYCILCDSCRWVLFRLGRGLGMCMVNVVFVGSCVFSLCSRLGSDVLDVGGV